MRRYDHFAVRAWARTALFDPFVTHMVVGQHWNSTPFPFGALYDSQHVRDEPIRLYNMAGNAISALKNPVTDNIDRELSLCSIHKLNRARQDEEVYALVARDAEESTAISEALAETRFRFTVEIGVPSITGSTIGHGSAMFENCVSRALPIRLRAEEISTYDILAQSSVLRVAMVMWDAFTVTFNRIIGIKNAIDARLALHSLLADVANDIHNDGHVGFSLERIFGELPTADQFDRWWCAQFELVRELDRLLQVDPFRAGFTFKLHDDVAPIPIMLMAAALLSNPLELMRVLRVACTRYTGEKK